jgi:hypothetical protein
MATSITLTMLGCFKERRSEISLIAVMGVPSRLSEESILMVLSATISPERRSLARLRHGVRAHTSEVEFTRLLRTLKESVGENEKPVSLRVCSLPVIDSRVVIFLQSVLHCLPLNHVVKA